MISLSQIEALDALDRHGTFQAAANALHKSYSSVVYQIRSLEAGLELSLLDRSRYRTRLTARGRSVLDAGRRLLTAQSELLRLGQTLRSGWEPGLRLVYDGILDVRGVAMAVQRAKQEGSTTRIQITVAFREGVEEEFQNLDADLMICISPPERTELPFVRLAPFRSFLVAAARHPLGKRPARGKPARVGLAQLREHTLVTVTGSNARLGLSTRDLERDSAFVVGDFHSKKSVIMEGLGYGWMPEHLIESELRTGSLRVIEAEIATFHQFSPRVYHRPGDALGKTGKLILRQLSQR